MDDFRPQHRPQQSKRLWPTPQQCTKLLDLGYPKSAVSEMTYREAETAITVSDNLPEYVKEHEAHYSLPAIKAVSGSQAIYARNCRYRYFKQVPATYGELQGARQQALFMGALDRLKGVTDAQYWIAKKYASLPADFARYLADK